MRKLTFVVALCLIVVACSPRPFQTRQTVTPSPSPFITEALPENVSFERRQLIESAIAQTKVTTGYDPSYVGIAYPNGDVAPETGVCSDVIVRAFRRVGIDLQKEVHEDMKRAWTNYPNKWGAAGTDTNIDHRRVLNLMTYFERQGKSLALSTDPAEFIPGDVVAWDLGNKVDHIGIVVNVWSEETKRYLIVHNIGAGTQLQDVLFSWTMIGHYRYFAN